MTPRQKTRLFQVGSVLLGLALMYLALRPVAMSELWETLAAANYWYLAPLAVAALLGHVLRSWRWLLLLDALPEIRGLPRSVTLRTAFYSVMIGYMVNYAAPRMGEVARSGNLAAQSRHSFSSVFGTVVIERVLDVVTLGIGIMVAFAIAANQMADLGPLVGEATSSLPMSAAALVLITALLSLGGAAGLLVVRHLRRQARQPGLAGRIGTMIRSFEEGLLSLLRSPRRVALILSTIAIWLCYLAMAYLPLSLLGITGLSLADAWVLLIVGSAAMIVPAPGGIGSFHYVTIHTMTQLFGVTLAAASAYAVLAHASQLVLYTIVGFACLLLQGGGLALRTHSTEADPSQEEPAIAGTEQQRSGEDGVPSR